ncbi:MAG: protein kinase domain-containing protein [Stackebrandtia sp.]
MELFAGRYRLVDPVGEGGMGSVWRAWDVKRRRYAAAKLLRSAEAGDVLRFVREQALRVEHPHVVAPIGWAAEDDKVLLAMDLVAGGSVHHLLGDYGPLPAPYAAVLVDQLLDALTAVHAHGIVHRDVKPSNLLLELTGRAAPRLRLSDFGIAVVAGEPRLTENSSVIGTRGYLPPEAMTGVDVAPGHDVYSAGVVAWQLLTGAAPPRNGPRPDADAPPEHVPEPLWREAAAWVAADPRARPTSAADARQRWSAARKAADLPPIDPADPDAVEVFDQLAPLPEGFGPEGPLPPASAAVFPRQPPAPHSEAPTVRLAPTPPQPATLKNRRTSVGLIAALSTAAVGLLIMAGSLFLLLRP